MNTRAPKDAIHNAEDAIEIANSLHRKDPQDFDIGKRLAGLYQSAALTNRMAEQRPRALELALLANDLFRELIQRHPEENGLRAELAGVTSNLGVIQQGLDRFEEARQSIESAIERLEQLCKEGPKNDSNQRNRMLAVAEKRYAATPGDQGATYDSAMAIGRTAGLRTSEPATRLALYEKSTGLLTEALVRDPANGEARSNLASHKELMGDLSISIGRQADGWKAYRESLRIVEERPVKVAIGRRVAISVSSRLAE